MAKSVSKIDTPKNVEATAREEQGGFLLDNLRLLGIIGLVLLVVAGGIFYFFVYKKAQDNEQALLELARVRPFYDNGSYALAISGDSVLVADGQGRGLEEIVDDWGGTSAGRIAALLLGNSYLATDQPERAEEPYELATNADDPLIRSAAHAGLGAVAEAAGRYEEAAEEYSRAASEDRLDLSTPANLIGAARNYERAGKQQEAIEHYRRVADQFPGSDANTEARLALARLGDES